MEELNIKTKNWKDLLTDEPFKRKDLITLQDPTNVEKFNISMFYHIQNNVKVETEGKNINILGCVGRGGLLALYKSQLTWRDSTSLCSIMYKIT